MKAGFRNAVSRARSSQRLVEALSDAMQPYGLSDAASAIVKTAMGHGTGAFDLDDGSALRAFLHGPLADSLEARLGNGITNMVLDALERAFGMLPTPEESGVIVRSREFEREPTTEPAPPRKTILLVTDDHRLRDTLLESLEQGGFAVILSQDPEQGAHLCRTVRPAAVVFDDGHPAQPSWRLEAFQRSLLDAKPRLILLTGRRQEATPRVAVVAPRTVEREALLAAIESAVAGCKEAFEGPVISESPARKVVCGESRALLEEALDALVAFPVRTRIIARALERAALEEVPSDMLAFAAFAVGPLHQLVSGDLGEDTASALVSELTAIVQRTKATSGVLRRARPAPSTPPAPRAPPGNNPQIKALLIGALCASFDRALERVGFGVSKVPDGHAAIDWCSLNHPQVVVTSSDVTGIAASQLAALLELTLGQGAPAVVCLSHDGAEKIAGVSRVLPHSANSVQLAKAIKASLTPPSDASS